MGPQRQAGQRKSVSIDDRFLSREPVMDADFEIIEAAAKTPLKTAQSSVPPVASEPKKPTADQIGMTVFGKKPARIRTDDSIAFYGLSAVLVVLSFWFSGGHSLFRQTDTLMTGSIKPVHATTEITKAAWQVISVNGKIALQVDGIVRNSSDFAVQTKPVTVTVNQSDGTTKRFLLGQKGWVLGPGQEVVVSGRLDIVSAAVASVVISATD